MSKQLDFRTSEPQTGHDWAGEHVITYAGKCPVCGTRMYLIDGHQGDPRGILGDHAASSIGPDDFYLPDDLPTIRFCFTCLNDGDRYRRAVAIASKRWGLEL